MEAISVYLQRRHAACDELFAQAEQDAAQGRWEAARTAWNGFVAACERHLGQEETVLFPLLERFLGASGGPTAVMRMEHQQMRSLFGELGRALEGADADAFLGGADTLLVLIQQHNTKEEQILYPMADRLLGGDAESVIRSLEQAGA
jgi:hemerythrin-like domain-containing protein